MTIIRSIMKKVKSRFLTPDDPGSRFIQAEKFINTVRMAYLGVMSLLFCVRWILSADYAGTALFQYHLVSLLLSWGNFAMVQGFISGRWNHRSLPWAGSFIDVVLIAAGFISPAFSPDMTFPSQDLGESSYYGVFSLAVLASVLRLNPRWTSVLAVFTVAVYGWCVFLAANPQGIDRYYLANEAVKLFILGVIGLITVLVSRILSRSLAEAERASRIKSEFLATMSHELRTPLNAILGFSDWIRTQSVPENLQPSLHSIHRSAENLAELIDDVLDLSCLEAGKITIQNRAFFLRELVRESVALVETRAKSRNISLQLNLEGLPDLVYSDPKRIRQVLMNLLDNALKFTPQGWIRISGTSRPQGTQTQEVTILVEDSGIGIQEKDSERIFRQYTQVETGKTRLVGGAGLGLSISRNLAQLLGGDLTLSSRPGEGSTFAFRFRSLWAPTVPQGSLVTSEDPDKAENFPLKILLVEDNETNQDVQSRLLGRLGAQVKLASNGLEALETLKKETFHLVLIDWQMPVMDGMETARRIREEIPGGGDLVLVAVTGHAFDSDREALLAGGFSDYLAKPVRLADLKKLLSRWNGASSRS